MKTRNCYNKTNSSIRANPKMRLHAPIEAYKSDLVVFNRWLGTKAISKKSMEDFIYWAEANRAPATVSRYKAALKASLRATRGNSLTLAEAAQISEVFSSIRVAQSEQRINEAQVITPKERFEIQKKSGTKTALIIQSLYETGARISEVMNLKISDCQLSRNVYYCRVIGKGKKQRTVYLSRQTFMAIRKAYNGSVYLFETNSRPVSRFTAHCLVRRAGSKVGRRLHPHTLRHSRATDLLKSGQTLPVVSAYLGHSTPAVTARFYLHDLPSPDKIMGI